MQGLEKELAGLIGDACFPLMQELAPISILQPRTLQERLYPPTYTLRVFAEDGGRASGVTASNLEILDLSRPIPESRFRLSVFMGFSSFL